MSLSIHNLRNTLIELTEKPINLTLNRNRCTYIKAIFQNPMEVSIHEAFLKAPRAIIHSLGAYLNGNMLEEERLYAFMQAYYKEQAKKNPLPIKTKGSTYDLQVLYRQLNHAYFDQSLDLTTTWWNNPPKPGARQCTLGVFLDTFQLIKIHSLLDSPYVPQYVVESVLFHEMAHAIIPLEKDAKGRTMVHTKSFCKKMEEYPHSLRADEWLKNNRAHFFKKHSSNHF